MKTVATVFLAYKANAYNKTLTEFLVKNAKAIKKDIALKVLLVKNVGKLNKAIKSLPAMEWVENDSAKYIVGVSDILAMLEKPRPKAPGDGMDKYWLDIMMSGDNDPDPNEEFGRKLPSLAEAMTQQRSVQSQAKKGSGQQRSHEDEDAFEGHGGGGHGGDSHGGDGSVASFEDDPLMKRFFENQETSPGESAYEEVDYGMA
jgi:hypothetical protein